jgi:glycosyltransferase involved in cell wall biosynthesis
VAVSQYTKDCIVAAADEVDEAFGTTFGVQCRARVGISYPAIDCFQDAPSDRTIKRVLAERGLVRDGFVLFLSRVTPEKGVDDLIDGFERSAASDGLRLVIAGTGYALAEMRERAAASPVADRIDFLDDVDDAEKRVLMAGCATFVLPSKPTSAFVETFGISLVEKMLAGGGPVITTDTGGILEAVGDTAMIIPICDPDAVAAAIDEAVLGTTRAQRRAKAAKARTQALHFDRQVVFDRLLSRTLVMN